MRPHRHQPTRLSRPWNSLGKNTGVGCHFLLQCMKVKSESEVAQLCPTLSDPMDRSLPGSFYPWDFPGKSTGVGCHCLLHRKLQCMSKMEASWVLLWDFSKDWNCFSIISDPQSALYLNVTWFWDWVPRWPGFLCYKWVRDRTSRRMNSLPTSPDPGFTGTRRRRGREMLWAGTHRRAWFSGPG